MGGIERCEKVVVNGLKDYRAVVTIEEHSIVGGLGSAVAEYLMGRKHVAQLFRIGIQDKFVHPGTQNYIKECNCLDAEGICAYIKQIGDLFHEEQR